MNPQYTVLLRENIPETGVMKSCLPYVCSNGTRSRETAQTFLVRMAKYPNIVALPEGLQGDHIILRNPKVAGFELMIVWKIHLDEEGRTTPVLDLLTKIPEQVLEQKLPSAQSVPARFRSMVLLLGIEAALESLLTLLH